MQRKQAQASHVATTELQDRFGGLLESHWKIVLKLTNIYCRNAEDRRDLAQEISLQLWRAFRTYDETRRFSTWMYRIALNVAISFDRAVRVRERHASPMVASEVEKIPSPLSDAEGHSGEFRQILDGLDPLNRALLLLHLEEHSYEEIGEILGLSETNVATKISRLKQALRKKAATAAGDTDHGN